MLRPLHGVLKGRGERERNVRSGADHSHAERIANHTEQLGKIEGSVPQEMLLVDLKAVLPDTVTRK